MFPSTEDQELSSRASRSQTGPPPMLETAGRSMLTPDKLGTTPCTSLTQSGPQCNSGERDKSQMSSSGLDSSKPVREPHPDSSTTRLPTQLGLDTMVISTTQRRFFTHSLVETKTNKSCSAWTPPLRRAELPSKPSGKLLASWLQKSSRWMKCNTLTRWASGFLTSLTSREFGNSIETTLLSPRSLKPLTLVKLLKETQTPPSSSWAEREPSTLLHSS